MKVAAALIVRNAEETIERCIRSVRPHVGMVAVYLAGTSQDRTVDVLERLRVEPGPPLVIEHGEWRDDFAWAREQSFAMVDRAYSWIVWLDADDELIGGRNLGHIVGVAETYGQPFAQMLYRYPEYLGAGRVDTEMSYRARVVHRDRGAWQGIVHEFFRPLPQYRNARYAAQVPAELAYVVHQHEQPRPVGRYLELIQTATQDIERNPRALFFLAMELRSLDRWDDALPPLLRYLSEEHDRIEGDPNAMRLAALEIGLDIAQHAGDTAVEGFLRHQHAAYAKRCEEHKTALEAGRSTRPPKVERNQLCPCGSGRKFKRCCG